MTAPDKNLHPPRGGLRRARHLLLDSVGQVVVGGGAGGLGWAGAC